MFPRYVLINRQRFRETMANDDKYEDLLNFFKFHQSNLTDEDKAAIAQAERERIVMLQRDIDELVSQHGAVPPPWFYVENSHPGDIMWRMGGGEWHIMVFWQWWEQSGMDEAARIAYFKKWPPPPRWMKWMSNAIWDLEPFRQDYAPYFAKLEAVGFEGVADFEKDDENWFKRDKGEEPA